MSTTSPVSIRTEAIAGVTTFVTMAYVIVVNPSILASEGTGMTFSGVLTATVLISFVMTLAMGLYAKIPFALAPGMGLNAFFAFTIILGMGVPWQVALGMVFWSGVLFVLLSVTPLRAKIALAIPRPLRSAAAAGIGLFLTFLGLKNAGFVAGDPVTFVRVGDAGYEMLFALGGMVLSIWLLRRRNPLAFLAGMLAVTLLAWSLGFIQAPQSFFSRPDFESVLFRLDLLGALQLALLPAIISLLFTDLFDSLSTFVGVADAAGLVDEQGQPRNIRQGLLVDAFATLGSGLAGTSPATTYIESSAGIEMGGRTGLTSVVTALCFLPCLFLAPLAAMVPPYASAPVLILVGAFMFRSVVRIPMETVEESIPPFLTVILIPLTFSITQGILWGFVSHVALFLLAGRRSELSPIMAGLGLLSAALLVLEYSR